MNIARFSLVLCVIYWSATSTVSADQGNFASHPGFKAYFASNPPRSELPTEQERAWLEQYRPRVFLADQQQAPIDFYGDYISRGHLYLDEKMHSNDVDQPSLNAVKNRSDAEFFYSGALPLEGTPTLYGRVDYDTLDYQEQQWELVFLSYNAVFPTSGLLAKLPFLARVGLGVIADLRDWHQLDHYVGVTVVLHRKQPIAYYLQQHNYQTTYLVQSQDWPDDDRVMVDISQRSNELYPHRAHRVEHPAVSFITMANIEFIKTGHRRPMMAGWDVTHGQRELQYTLSYLPPDDAFYQFKGRLGESRRLPGRDGPPGADYVQLPGLMPWSHRLVCGFRPSSVEREQKKLEALLSDSGHDIRREGIENYKQDFIHAWLNLESSVDSRKSAQALDARLGAPLDNLKKLSSPNG